MTETLQYLPQDIRQTYVDGAELARMTFETQDINTKNLIRTPEAVAKAQEQQAAREQVAIELDKARANKLNASAEAQRAMTALRAQKQQMDGDLAVRKQMSDEEVNQSDRQLAASKMLGDLAKVRLDADAKAQPMSGDLPDAAQ